MRIIIAILFFISSIPAHGQIGSGFASDSEEAGRTRISEYFYSKTGREILKPVQLLGSVEKPGIYHVPAGTPFLTLLSLSGGPKDKAATEKIVLTRSGGEQKTVDLKDLMRSSQSYTLNEGDTVFIPTKEGLFSSEQTNDITVVVGLATLLLTIFLVVDRK